MLRGTGAGGPRYPAWLALPAVGWYVAFFLSPLAIMALYSVSRQEGFTDVVYAFDLENYRYLWDRLYGQVFLRTLGLAFFGTL
jgi:ABC-type spermidine/putrescine transport system permease subunit I